jgi:hypothetical protein
MTANRVIHTGENNQLGGVKGGFLSAAYQFGMAGVVKTDPTTPANWQTIMLNTNLIILTGFIFNNRNPGRRSLVPRV